MQFTPRLLLTLAGFLVLIALALFTLDGNIRLATLIVLGVCAARTLFFAASLNKK